jgi:argininosuccinate synthase
VVLGFSGGLDTSYCVKYLTDEKGYEVHSVIVNTGGFTEEELTAGRKACIYTWCKNAYHGECCAKPITITSSNT